MDYKKIIQRKLGEIVNFKNKTSSYSFNGLPENKKREIIVFLRNQSDLDKQQLMEFAQERFNVSEFDAEKLFYEAYPDGLDLKEAMILNELNTLLQEINPPVRYINSAFNKEKEDIEIDPIVDGNIRLLISTLCHRRNIF